MLVQYNIIDRSNEEMLAYAHEKGLDTVAMGTVGGGRLSEACKNCGFCEKKCPQHLQIREQLKKVEAIFK